MRVQVAPPKAGRLTLIADVAMSAGRLVRYSSAGHINYFDPTSAQTWGIQLLGVTRTAVDINMPVEVITGSEVIYLPGWGLTTGTAYYATSNGNITITPPTSGVLLQVGTAIDTDRFHFNPSAPIVLNGA